MENKSPGFLHKIGANLPLYSLFGIIIFIYTVFQTYLGKLLANDYDYDKGRTTPEGQLLPVFLTMNTIVSSTNNVASYLQTKEIALTEQEQKGFIYFIVSHAILILLFVSIYRTMVTPPGGVPLEWSLTVQNDLYSAAEAEKILLLDQYRRSKKELPRSSYHARRSTGTKFRSTSPIKDVEQTQTLQTQGEDLPEIDEGPEMMKEISNLAYYNAMKKDNRRFCTYCRIFKPERTHHCQQCNACILKMDHHCPWVSNCIGFRNYKYFFNMTFYGVLILLFVIATYTEAVIDTLFNVEISLGLSFWIFFTSGLTCLLGLVVTGFFIFHIWLIMTGKTTLEFLEKRKMGDYNLGCWENAKITLGTNVLTWLVPTTPHYKTDGVDFQNKMRESNL